ncbi:MAG: hypothetical protein ACR2QC_04795 [Gammaproteobacteria bacterium]
MRRRIANKKIPFSPVPFLRRQEFPPPRSGGKLYAFGDSLRLSARRFLPSQEWN